MTHDFTMAALLETAKDVAQVIPKAKWYGFGSYFRGEPNFSDVDILVVCDTTDEAATVRRLSRSACSDWPIHLNIMTTAEAEETSFVESESCVRFY